MRRSVCGPTGDHFFLINLHMVVPHLGHRPFSIGCPLRVLLSTAPAMADFFLHLTQNPEATATIAMFTWPAHFIAPAKVPFKCN